MRRYANNLIHGLCQALAPGCIPLFTSDGLDLYFYALTAHFGSWVTDPATGNSIWHVAKDLICGQFVKHCRRHTLRGCVLTAGCASVRSNNWRPRCESSA
jgi:hypothetical protein